MTTEFPGPLIVCPNCEAAMNVSSGCPECIHADDDPDCGCQHCEAERAAEDDGSCTTCGGSGGGVECFRCPKCGGTGRRK